MRSSARGATFRNSRFDREPNPTFCNKPLLSSGYLVDTCDRRDILRGAYRVRGLF